MRRRRVCLLDIGLDSYFDSAMAFVQSTLDNINIDHDNPVADVDFVRSRDPDTVLTAFTASCDVLHVTAHGDHSVTPTFSSSDGKTQISMEQLGERAADLGRGISTGAILADGCKTGTGAWQKAVRDCLQGRSPTSAPRPRSAGTRAPSSVLPSTARCSATRARVSPRRSRRRTRPGGPRRRTCC
ncbi:hypothetical protein [Micromonospora zhanjiangensis]